MLKSSTEVEIAYLSEEILYKCIFIISYPCIQSVYFKKA